MNVRDILYAIMYISIIGLAVESWLVFFSWKNRLHSYLFFSCIVALVNNLGYLLELKATTEEAYITALQLSYAGRVWVVFGLFFFAMELVGKRVPVLLEVLMGIVNLGIYGCVLTLTHHNLYYKNMRFIPGEPFPEFSHQNGIVHNLYFLLLFVYILVAIVTLFRARQREKNRMARNRILMVILAFVAETMFFVIEITHLMPITRYFDMTMLGSTVGTIFMFVAILRCDLLGTVDLAREFMIDRLSEGIIATDSEGNVQYFNKPARRLYPELAIRPSAVLERVKKALAEDANMEINHRIYTPEENDLVYLGENFGKVYVLRDETGHFRHIRELQEQKDIADSANAAKSRFLASMSHEIRTPINAVLGMDEMILRESREKTIRSYATDIMSAGRTLLSLINDILDLSKVEEGKMEIIPVEYDLASLISDLSNMIRERAEKKGLSLTFQVDERAPHLLRGDEIRLRQCVVNLLTNAVKYTEKGSVTMKLGFEKKDAHQIALSFAVEDTGIGMKQEDMEKLFSPYQRIEEERNRSIEGTGLGMSITRQLLELMGSELKVESEYGSGSVFSFTVIQEVMDWDEIGDYTKHYEDSATVSRKLFTAPGAEILVVDDTEMNLRVIRALLKRTGIGIETVMSGREAIDLCEERAFDVIFVDHMMPDMDGIETLAHIRGSRCNATTPAVALTANAVSGARQRYLDAGFTDYLSKPIDSGKLEKMLIRLLPEEKYKISRGEEPEEAGAGSLDAVEGLPDWICQIPPVNAAEGVNYCGCAEAYMDVVAGFVQDAASNAKKLEDALEAEDLKLFTIKVHALKSSARIIGARELSEMAGALEEAGKSGDLARVREGAGALLETYRKVVQSLCRACEPREDLPRISEESLQEAFGAMEEIARAWDYEMMEAVLQRLRAYRLPSEAQSKVQQIEKLLLELDFDAIEIVAKQ